MPRVARGRHRANEHRHARPLGREDGRQHIRLQVELGHKVRERKLAAVVLAAVAAAPALLVHGDAVSDELLGQRPVREEQRPRATRGIRQSIEQRAGDHVGGTPGRMVHGADVHRAALAYLSDAKLLATALGPAGGWRKATFLLTGL